MNKEALRFGWRVVEQVQKIGAMRRDIDIEVVVVVIEVKTERAMRTCVIFSPVGTGANLIFAAISSFIVRRHVVRVPDLSGSMVGPKRFLAVLQFDTSMRIARIGMAWRHVRIGIGIVDDANGVWKDLVELACPVAIACAWLSKGNHTSSGLEIEDTGHFEFVATNGGKRSSKSMARDPHLIRRVLLHQKTNGSSDFRTDALIGRDEIVVSLATFA